MSLNLVKESVNEQYKATSTGGVDDPLMIAGRLSDGGVGQPVFQGAETATVFCKAQARKNKQDKCESLNRVKKVLPSLAPFQLGIFSNVAGSPHGDVVFDWVVNCVTAIAQGLVDGKIPASQQIYNAICERTIISSACAERLVPSGRATKN